MRQRNHNGWLIGMASAILAAAPSLSLAQTMAPGVAQFIAASPPPAPAAPPGMTTMPGMPGTMGIPPAPGASPAAMPKDVPEPPPEEEVKLKSFFFSAEEMQQIRQALRIYAALGKGRDTSKEQEFLNQLEGLGAPKTPQQAQATTYPQFYLQSLNYHSPTDWAVRINNFRITPKDDKANLPLRVVDISADKVTLEWKPTQMDRVIDSWNKSPNDAVKFDQAQGTLTFSLRPNQTFSSYAMKALEGKVKPVSIEAVRAAENAAANKPVAPATPESIPGTPPISAAPGNPVPSATPQPEKSSGLGGLIDAYTGMGERE